MKIFTTEGIRAIDQATIIQEGGNPLSLMERAASAITYEIISRWRPSKRMVIFAGPGNNGGDALAVARMLVEQGYKPHVILFNLRSTQLSEPCAINRQRLLQLENFDQERYFTEVVKQFDAPYLDESTVVIDGLFGTGLKSPLKGGFTSLVQLINESGAYVVSIDVPSGLFGEWNRATDRRNIIRANLTLAFQFKRLAFFFSENADFVGECKVLDIELSQDAIDKTATDYYLIEADDIKDMFRPRGKFSNKYDNGKLLLVAGSYGMMGAAVLASIGAMRAGAGLVTVHTPIYGSTPLQTAVPEVLIQVDKNEIHTTSIDVRRQFDAIALGPGLGVMEETINAVDTFLKKCHTPVILDADAINCIAKRPALLRCIPAGSIITPHAAEFDRLFGQHNTDEERLSKAIESARLYNITIVLKGHYTMTVRPDGKIYINQSGNPGMATAGSGDVLTGVVAAFIAQGYPSDLGVVMAVFVHGRAGDIAVQQHGEYGIMASDIAHSVGKAIQSIIDPNPNNH